MAYEDEGEDCQLQEGADSGKRFSDDKNNNNPLFTALARKRSRNAPLLKRQPRQQLLHNRQVQDQDHRKQQEHRSHIECGQQHTRRPFCSVCARPQRVCICSAVGAVGGPVSLSAAFGGILEAVVVYIHPLEAKRKMRSLTLLQQLLHPVHVFVCRKPQPVEQLLPLQHPRNLLLLFPTAHSSPLPVVPYEESCAVVASSRVRVATPLVGAATAATESSAARRLATAAAAAVSDVARLCETITDEHTSEKYSPGGAGHGCGDPATACAEPVAGQHVSPDGPVSLAPTTASASLSPASAAASPAVAGLSRAPCGCTREADYHQPAVAAERASTSHSAAECTGRGNATPCLGCFPLQLPLTLICLDGTWKECKEMFNSVEWLRHLPAVHLPFLRDSSSAEHQQHERMHPLHEDRQYHEDNCIQQRCPSGGQCTNQSQVPQRHSEQLGQMTTHQQRLQQKTQHPRTQEPKKANDAGFERQHCLLLGKPQQAVQGHETPQKLQLTQQPAEDQHLLRPDCKEHRQKLADEFNRHMQDEHDLDEEKSSGTRRSQQQISPINEYIGVFSSVRTPPPAIAGAGGVCTAEAICHTMAAIARYSRHNNVVALRFGDSMCKLLGHVAQQQSYCRQEARQHHQQVRHDAVPVDSSPVDHKSRAKYAAKERLQGEDDVCRTTQRQLQLQQLGCGDTTSATSTHISPAAYPGLPEMSCVTSRQASRGQPEGGHAATCCSCGSLEAIFL